MKRTRPSKARADRRKVISPDSGHLVGAWSGHYPVTCVAMMSLLDRLVAGDDRFSAAERILFVACEFWSAFNAGDLDSYFDLRADDPTRDARLALRLVGAIKIARLLERGVLGSAIGRAAIKRRVRLAQLEDRLRATTEPVDLLIARFAWRSMAAQRRRSTVQTAPSPGLGNLNPDNRT